MLEQVKLTFLLSLFVSLFLTESNFSKLEIEEIEKKLEKSVDGAFSLNK